MWKTEDRVKEVNRDLKGKIIAFFMAGILLFMGGCGTMENRDTENNTETGSETASAPAGNSESDSETEDSQESSSGDEETLETTEGQGAAEKVDYVTEGTKEYRGFTLDNVLHSETQGDIHFNLYVPDSYDGEEPCAVFFTLPGYEGLYFQGVGENLYSENFGFEAQAYDPDRVYGEGYSGGGETMSQVMGKRPELFAAYLQCSSQWDGDYEPVIESRTPVYFVIGESDEYYGSQPTQEAYDNLYELYRQEGLSDEEINQLLVLDIKDADYFESQGVTVQHGGGNLFAQDEEIMGWLFSKQR